MKTISKILGVIALLIFSVFAGQIGKIVGVSAVDNYEKGKTEGALQSVLDKVANELNSKTPMMVDSETRLDNVVSIRKTLRYNYTLINFSNNDISAERIQSVLNETVTNKVCSSMKNLISLGATIEYAYYENRGNLITIISIPPTKCNR